MSKPASVRGWAMVGAEVASIFSRSLRDLEHSFTGETPWFAIEGEIC